MVGMRATRCGYNSGSCKEDYSGVSRSVIGKFDISVNTVFTFLLICIHVCISSAGCLMT